MLTDWPAPGTDPAQQAEIERMMRAQQLLKMGQVNSPAPQPIGTPPLTPQPVPGSKQIYDQVPPLPPKEINDRLPGMEGPVPEAPPMMNNAQNTLRKAPQREPVPVPADLQSHPHLSPGGAVQPTAPVETPAIPPTGPQGDGGPQQLQLPPEDVQMVQQATANVQRDPEGFAGKARQWMDNLGSMFSLRTEGQDPQAINETYGVPNAQVWAAQRSALFNAGVILMAAGQNNTPQNRAAILTKLGGALGSVSNEIYKTAQAGLMRAQAANPRGKRHTYGEPEYDPSTGRYFQRRSDGKIEFAGSTPPKQKLLQEMATNWINPDSAKGGLVQMRNSAEAIQTVDNMLLLMDEGIIQGATAGWQEMIANAAEEAGVLSEYKRGELERTQVIEAYVNDVVLPRMSMLGGSDSNEELRKLESAIRNKTFTIGAAREILSNVATKERRRFGRFRDDRNRIPDEIMPRDWYRGPDEPEMVVDYTNTRKRTDSKPSAPDRKSGEVELKEGEVRTTKAGHKVKVVNGKTMVMRKGTNKWVEFKR